MEEYSNKMERFDKIQQRDTEMETNLLSSRGNQEIRQSNLYSNNKILPQEQSHYDEQSSEIEKQKNKKKKIIISSVILIILVTIIIIIIILVKKKSSDAPYDFPKGYNPYIVDEYSQNNDLFIQRGIIYFQNKSNSSNQIKHPFLIQDSKKIEIDTQNIPLGSNNQLIKNISYEIGQMDFKVSYLILTDQLNERWSPPIETVAKGSAQQTMRMDMNNFKLNYNPFSFSFSSTRSSDVLITTENQTFYMTDKFIQMDFKLPSQRIYGLGERKRKFNLEEGTWTMWANGQESKEDDGSGSLQSYGVHPFVLVQCKEKTEFFGIYFRNSNAQSPILTFNNNLKTSMLSYITTGGQLEVYFFTKGTAKDIIANYQRFIGLPQLPPLWSLGWHASSKMYTNLSQIQQNVQNYNDSNIPLEGIWVDKYYMKDLVHFTVDQDNFHNFSQYQQTLQQQGKKLILVVGPGLQNVQGDHYVSQAIANNCLIIGNDQKPLESKIWGNSTYFLDFFNQNCSSLWNQGLQDLFKQINFDGLWLDMNEPTTSCNGAINQCQSNESLINRQKTFKYELNTQWYTTNNNQSNISTYFLPFIPSNRWNLDNLTLSLNATHSQSKYKQYDTHSMYGHMQSKATFQFLNLNNSNDKRAFLLSRSTFSGSGKYTNHWLGENQRSFEDMKLSIAGIMNFNLFGIPFVGANVCGYTSLQNQYEDEICGRWIQLSTFYPFARIDGDLLQSGLPNEPYNLNGKYKIMAQKSIQERFKYMRFMYTCLFRASQEGKTCFDPLLYHYPELDQVYQDIEHTFIVGDALKVSPVLQHLQDDQSTYQVYFPKGEWVSLKNYADIISVTNNDGEYVNLQAPDDTINVHLRPGYMVPIQENTLDGKKFNLTSEIRQNPIILIANRDTNKQAQALIFLDKDDSISAIQNKFYEYYELHLQNNSLIKFNLNSDNREYQGTNLLKLIITNADDLSDIDTACVISEKNQKIINLAQPQFNQTQKTLTIMADFQDLKKTIQMYQMQMIHFSNSKKGIDLCRQKNNSRYYWKTQLDLTQFESTSILASRNGGLPDLKFTAKVLQSGILSIYWTFNDYSQLEKTPFEVPIDILDAQKDNVSQTQNLSNYIVMPSSEYTDGPLLTIVNQQFIQNTTIYSLSDIILSEYLNMIDSQVYVSSGNSFQGIMGIAERVSNGLFLDDGVYSLWSRDQPDPVETGQPPGNNMYGTHPFYMARAKDDTWLGVFTNLANAQDWWIKNDNNQGIINVTCYATGGVADIYFMFGKDPNEVTKQYHKIVGTPVLTPQWALGWHQSRWGYNSTNKLKEVIQNYSINNIPLDTIWSDIDYMKNYQDFTIDQKNFVELPNFIDYLHQYDKNLHYIPIVDAGIAQRQNSYEAYKDGVKKDIFIKTYDNKDILTGQVWPVDAVFPDFFNPKGVEYWQYWIDKLYSQIKFDGLWQDMNEIANFCQGVCYQNQASPNPLKFKLPYIPTGRDLESKSLPLEGSHFNSIKEIDAHSLFGTQQTKASHEWFKKQNKRTMIIQRSAYAGLGKFGSRWLGDNFSQNDYMGYSVTGIMMHNILGIPLAGSDICGFMLNTTAELCARWHIVGSFYPFSRNHNGWNSISQEPYIFTDQYSQNMTYMDIMRIAIRNKYHLIRYYYTQMSLISQEGGAFYKPLFFEFPNDNEAYKSQIYNVMIGSSMKLSVQSNTNQNNTYFYFPQGAWCQVFNTSAQNDSCIISDQNGTTILLETQVHQFYLHLRGGHIVALQNASNLNVKTTKDLQQHPIDLHVHPYLNEETGNYQANGVYLNDDGEVLDVNGYQNQYTFNYQHKNNSNLLLSVDQTKNAFLIQNQIVNANDFLNSVEIYNSYGLNLTSNYQVQLNLNDGSSLQLKNIAKYNFMNQRLELMLDRQISLISLKEIEYVQIN